MTFVSFTSCNEAKVRRRLGGQEDYETHPSSLAGATRGQFTRGHYPIMPSSAEQGESVLHSACSYSLPAAILLVH